MFKIIASFLGSVSPVAVLLLGAVPALAVGWGAREAKFALWDSPALIREATAKADGACAIRTMDAANRAEQATRASQQAANAEALRIYREALDASQEATLTAQSQLEQEIADHEISLAAEGRSCLLTGADIDWLYQRGAAGAD